MKMLNYDLTNDPRTVSNEVCDGYFIYDDPLSVVLDEDKIISFGITVYQDINLAGEFDLDPGDDGTDIEYCSFLMDDGVLIHITRLTSVTVARSIDENYNTKACRLYEHSENYFDELYDRYESDAGDEAVYAAERVRHEKLRLAGATPAYFDKEKGCVVQLLQLVQTGGDRHVDA